MTLTDADGHVEWVNEGFTKLTGHTFEEVRGKKPGAVLQGADTDMKTVQFMHDQLQKGEAFSVEILNYSKTGAKHWIALEVQPIRDEHGTIRNYMGIKIDITKRKLLEHRLSLYNAISKIFGSAETLEGGMRKILQTIVENEGWQLGAIWNVDRPTNTLYCAEVWSSPNISIPQFTDVLRKMHLSQGVGLAGRVWAESEPVWICDILKEPDMPNAEGAEKDGLRSAIGFPIRINGRFWGVMEFMAANIDKPDSNLLHMFESLGRQCSQFIIRKIAEADLLETNTLQKAILDSANFSIISTDEHGMIRSFNAEAEQMLGYSSDEVVGKFTPELFHDKDEIVREASAASTELGKTIEPGFEAFIARARQKIVDEREWIYIHKSGGRVPVLLSVSALRTAAGTITGFVGIAADITQRKKNEEELRSSLAEVERFNKLMFTRELRVIELKEEVNELRKQHGEALLYTSVETETR